MKMFSSLIKSCNSETLFYCVRIMNVLEVAEKEIYVSTPLKLDEFRDFIESRIPEHLQDRVRVVECYQKLTAMEQEELYGLDSFARILSAINANAKRYWDIVYYSDNKGLCNILTDTATAIEFLKSGKVISIKLDGWKAR